MASAQMTADALIAILGWIRDAEIDVWLDGGWGVDALLETQTRAHKDVDIIVALPAAESLTRLLERHGFRENKEPGARLENGELWVFPPRGFLGRGRVNGVEVRCLSPEIAVECHASGYVPKETDFADMERLERRFGVELPPQLRRPEKRS